MHYKNGREAKVGDKIVGADSLGNPFAGVLVSASGNSTTCNGQVVPFSSPTWYVTLKDCVHVDDLAIADIPDKTKMVNEPVK